MNADLFAAETGVDSSEAARILDATRDHMIEDRLGFITETVFSDPYGQKLAMLRKAVAAGYDVTLLYIGIASAALSERRIEQRITRGGHDVPRDRLASRYKRSLVNLREAISFVPRVELFDNSLIEAPFSHIATFRHGTQVWRAAGRAPAWCRGIVTRAGRTR